MTSKISENRGFSSEGGKYSYTNRDGETFTLTAEQYAELKVQDDISNLHMYRNTKDLKKSLDAIVDVLNDIADAAEAIQKKK